MSGSIDQSGTSSPNFRERRKFSRKRSLLGATVLTPRGALDCRMLDFSCNGARVECTAPVGERETLTLVVEPIGTFPGVVSWRGEGCFGMDFVAEAATTSKPIVPPVGAATGVPRPGRRRRAATVNVVSDGQKIFQLRAGEILFRSGDPGGRMYIVQSGTVRVQGSPADEEIGPGGMVGIVELIERGLRRATTAVSLTDCVVMEVDARRFRELVAEAPGFALAVMRALARQIRHARKGGPGTP